MADEKAEDAFLAEPIKWPGPSQYELWQLEEGSALGIVAPLPENENRQKLMEIRKKKEQAEQLVHLQKLQKLHLLLKHHKLENNPDGILVLCLILCSELYPGFKVQRNENRGRKKKWDATRYFQLIADIHWIKEEKKVGVEQACRIILQRENNNERPTAKKVSSLASRYSEAKNPKINIFAKFFNTGNIEFDTYMLEQIALIFRK